MRIIWRLSALEDLRSLRQYVAETDPGNAAVVVSRILDSVETLATFPERGRIGRVQDTRDLVVPRTPYIVTYRVRNDIIRILRVRHGARRWPAS